MLLLAIRRDFDRQLCRDGDVIAIHETPTPQLRAIGKVEIFSERIGLPAAGVYNGLLAPYARGPVEIEEEALGLPHPVLQGEVGVELERLGPREQ